MGLVPSRESLYGNPAPASQPHILPFISRAAESYTYKTNRTERVFGTGVASSWIGGLPAPVALRNGLPTAELAHKIVEADQNAVFIEDPAEATAAVAASRGGRKSPVKKIDVDCRGRGSATAALETAAAEALRQGKIPYVYYYEHRVLPLTTEFFPSPDCVLFRQLWHARQQQNPRYHFQLSHTWSPGALTDPTAAYESLAQLAKSNMRDIQAACLATGQPIPREDIAQAQAQLQAAVAALEGGGISAVRDDATPATSQSSGVPFATREEFYNLVIRTTQESRVYHTNRELRDIICGAAKTEDDFHRHTPTGATDFAAAASRRTSEDFHRLRPVPCAIVLVRRCMPAHEYRYTYFVSNNERHHKTGAGAAGGASRRRGPTNGGGSGDTHQQQQQRSLHSTCVCTEDVRTAVRESHAVERVRRSEIDEEELTVPWVQVSLPQAPLGLCELRVVGMYGCWTVEEVLRHTLFTPTVHASANCDDAAAAMETRDSRPQETPMGKVLRRAAPHGVPSTTLLNTIFFEKQVGDKEQCHTYFALCRLFAHGMRQCILSDTSDMTDVKSAEGPSSTPKRIPPAEERKSGKSPGEDDATREHARTGAAWQAFLHLLSGDASAPSLLGDLANCFLIRFSNIPQLQLCRQIRRMLTELQNIFPDPPTLEGFQAAQRQRNMAAMSKKTEASNKEADIGDAAAVDRCTSAGSPVNDCGKCEGVTAPPSPQGASRSLIVGSEGVLTSSAREAAGDDPPESTADGKRSRKASGLPRSLDPEAIAERPPQLCERERLETQGFCCYVSHGLVVFRISRVAVANALNQLSFSPLQDSIEALCVTLTAAAPPPLTYRGELRPPVRLRTHTKPPVSVEECNSAEEVEDDEQLVLDRDEEGSGSVAASAATPSQDALENMYNSAVRYSSSCSTGFSMMPLWPVEPDSASWAGHAMALEVTPDELIGVLPRNSIEQRRGRFLPLRGVLMSEEVPSPLNGGRNRGALYRRCNPDPYSPPSPQQQHHHSSAPCPTHASDLFQMDVYTVSAELDGRHFRELVELVQQQQQQQQQRCPSTTDGSPLDNRSYVMIESVDAYGNIEPDSVLNWSPMATLGSLRWKRALAAAGCGNAEARGQGSGGDAALVSMEMATKPSPTATGSQRVVSVFLHEPERILRTGDRIRFSSYRDDPSNSEEQQPLKTAPGSGTPHSRSRRGSNAAAGDLRYGYWYVDDNLTTEDMILSWMRRVGGRARETRGTDTKWVRYPEPVLQVLLRFAHTCRHQPGGGWLATGQSLLPLHPSDEELVEPDLLQNYPDILRTRRFRQWRFSHDGYVYFHGVTVRIPGTAPPSQSHPPPAAVTAASAYHAPAHTCCEATLCMVDRRTSGAAVGSNALNNVDSSQQQQQQQRAAQQYGDGLHPSTTLPQNSRSANGGAQYGASTLTGRPVSYTTQAMATTIDGNGGGDGTAPKTHYDPSIVRRPTPSYLSVASFQQPQPQLAHQPTEPYTPQHTMHKRQYVNVAPLHHPIQVQRAVQESPEQHHRGGGYGHASPHDSGFGPHPQYAPTSRACGEGASDADAMTCCDYGTALASTGEVVSGVERITPNTVGGRYCSDADYLQSNVTATVAGSGIEQAAPHRRSHHHHHMEVGGSTEGTPCSGEGPFDCTDAASLQPRERAPSAPTMMGPSRAANNFYRDMHHRSEQLHLHPHQQQRYPCETLPQSHSGEPCNGHGVAPWGVDNTHMPYRSAPNASDAVFHGQEPQSPSMAFTGGGQSHEDAMRSTSPSSTLRGVSEHQHSLYYPQQRPPTSVLLPTSAPALPPAPPQPMNPYLYGEGDRVSYTQERRASQHYPRRCSPSTILGPTTPSAPVTNPTPQQLSSYALRAAHTTGNHRHLPPAPLSPDVADSSPLSPDSGDIRRSMTFTDRTPEDVDHSSRRGIIRSIPSELTFSGAFPVQQLDTSPNSPQMCQGTLQIHRQPPPPPPPSQQQQQQSQQRQAPLLRSPQIVHSPGSFRDIITADVIEANSITVRVMQRKPSTARQSSYNVTTGWTSVAGYRAGSGVAGHSSTVAVGDSGIPNAGSPSQMSYGAMGVSPSGGVEGVRDDVNLIHHKTAGGALSYDARSRPGHQPYETPQGRTSAMGQRVVPMQSTASTYSAPQSQHPTSTVGSSISVQRPGQRVSHNPYTKACSPSSTPQTAAAAAAAVVSSVYSQGGAGGGMVDSSGANDFFSDALDNRYGGTSDFNASASPAPAGFVRNGSSITHDTFYSPGAGGTGGQRSTPTRSQRPSGYLSQRAAGDASDFSRIDQLHEGRRGSYMSFYDGGQDVQVSTNFPDYYDNAVSDGTAQGFFFSMGDCEDSGNTERGLYGASPNYNYQVAQGHVMEHAVHPDHAGGRTCSLHVSVPASTCNMDHEKRQPRNEIGGGIDDVFVYGGGTPMSVSPYSQEQRQHTSHNAAPGAPHEYPIQR
ncbi:hypothetical protein JKF63_03869 [Porcisia hertigi]|uniref:Uncharacterized protein n=1 Tax=Porcisia hertigi TaxID=2761500 RepID=A0A836HU45_9TRYP|nr:hypothetical protein JKF63_03869 [Porcisia hertigi]